LGEVAEKPLEEEDVSELGEEAICVMADMAVRLLDMPDMLDMDCMCCCICIPMLIPDIDILGNMLDPDNTVIIFSKCLFDLFLYF
jgi:hypothetical protein